MRNLFVSRTLAWVTILLIAAGVSMCKENKKDQSWGYEGDVAAEHWGSLKPEYELCSTGKEQSPVNIAAVEETDLPDLQTDYKASPIKVINNGHTIQANFDKASTLTIDGKVYNLIQVHFHAPSENTLDDEFFPMEGHLVHQAADKSLAVIGVFYKASESAKENAELQKIWGAIPEKTGVEKAAEGIEPLDAYGLMPADRSYYRFVGSLTTPPCSEGVTWTVLKEVVELPESQIKAFQDYYSNNNRPVQPINDRVIKSKK